MPFKYPSMAARLLANSVVSSTQYYNGTPCWIWTARYSPNGYPRLAVRWRSGPRKGTVRVIAAHRESIRVFKKRGMPKKYVAKHLCNNTCCINPAHLVGGTQKSNIRQCVKDGRHKSGFTPRR